MILKEYIQAIQIHFINTHALVLGWFNKAQEYKHIEITSEQELKDSYGNIIKTKKGKIEKFTLGNIVFADAPVGFFKGQIGRQKISLMGGDIIKRYNFVLDPKREFIFIKSNSFTGVPFVSG